MKEPGRPDQGEARVGCEAGHGPPRREGTGQEAAQRVAPPPVALVRIGAALAVDLQHRRVGAEREAARHGEEGQEVAPAVLGLVEPDRRARAGPDSAPRRRRRRGCSDDTWTSAPRGSDQRGCGRVPARGGIVAMADRHDRSGRDRRLERAREGRDGTASGGAERAAQAAGQQAPERPVHARRFRVRAAGPARDARRPERTACRGRAGRARAP